MHRQIPADPYPLDRGTTRSGRYRLPRRPGHAAAGAGAARGRSRTASETSEIARPTRAPGGVNVQTTCRAPGGTSTARRSPSSSAGTDRPSISTRPARVDDVGDDEAPGPGRRDDDAIGLARDDARGLRRAPGPLDARERQRGVVPRDDAEAVAVDDRQARRRLPRRRHVVAHGQRAQLRRRVAQRELEVAIDLAPAVGGEHQARCSA